MPDETLPVRLRVALAGAVCVDEDVAVVPSTVVTTER